MGVNTVTLREAVTATMHRLASGEGAVDETTMRTALFAILHLLVMVAERQGSDLDMTPEQFVETLTGGGKS